MSEKKKNTGFALACWILVALILLIFFLVKKDVITTNLKKTDFFGRLFGVTPEFVKNHEEPPTVPKDSGGDIIEIDLLPPKEQHSQPQTSAEQNDAVSEKNTDNPEKAVPESPEKKTVPADGKPAEKPTATKVPAAQTDTTISLCFVVIDSDGSVSRRTVKRTVPKNDSPLTNAVNALLAGPSASEADKNCMSLIPRGTKLLGASVKNGIATLNFSEEFEFNSVGVEGYIGQLMQIVYTATEFPTVNSVQFLIEGEHKDYLGSEGQWIGTPLARSSFN